MKTTRVLLCVLALILAAGCATRDSRYATYYDPPVIDTSTSVAAEADRALADLVRAQFNRYGDLARLAPDVHISTRNGMVTVTGDVPSNQDRRMVIAMVENTPGVVTVNDQLHVTTVTAARPLAPTVVLTPNAFILATPARSSTCTCRA